MIGWELLPPPGESLPGWLDDIGEFRGRVLYDGGRRPGFQRTDGTFADADRLDHDAHHLLARVDGVIVGCVRVLPVSGRETSLTEHLIGPDRFAAMLRTTGVDRSRSSEGGRWVVDPLHRSARLGVLLAAGGVAVARALGFGLLFCPVGTRGKQDRVLARLGLAPLPEVPLLPAPEWDDDVRVMYVFPDRPAAHVRELMDTMAAQLNLPPGADVTGDRAGERPPLRPPGRAASEADPADR